MHLYWDASALAKRYVAELGSQTVTALFAAAPSSQMVTTIMSYSETFAALLRKQNQNTITAAAFTAAQAALRNEIIDDPDFVVLGIEYDDILDGIDLIRRYNLNSADAAMLHAFVKHAAHVPSATSSVVVASDQRLLRGAKGEGFEVLNPENISPVDVPTFLAGL